jgi:hypothetical protein
MFKDRIAAVDALARYRDQAWAWAHGEADQKRAVLKAKLKQLQAEHHEHLDSISEALDDKPAG